MRRFLLSLLFISGIALGSSGTVSISRFDFKKYEVVVFSFTATAGGAATKDVGLMGRVVKVITNPDGVAAPSANWDLYFYDSEDSALSLTSTALENRHTSNTEVVYPLIAGSTGTVSSVPPVAAGTYTFTVANAGSGGSGRVLVYLER